MFKYIYQKVFGSQLRTNIATGISCNIISSIALLFSYPLFLHYLGLELYGLWLALATVMNFASMSELGIKSATTKMIAEEYGQSNFANISKYINSSLALLCINGGIMLLALLLFRQHFVAAFKLSDEYAAIILQLLPYMGLLSIYVLLTEILHGTLAGLGRSDLSHYIRSAEPFIKLLSAGTMLVSGYGIISLLIGTAIAYLIVSWLCIHHIRKITKSPLFNFRHIEYALMKKILCFGGSIFAGSLIGMATKPLTSLLLSRYAGLGALPIYEIAYYGSMKIRTLFASALTALMPEFSRFNAISHHAQTQIKQLYYKALKLFMLFILPCYLILLLLSPILLALWLQDRFINGMAEPMQIMLLAGLIHLLSSPAEMLLIGLGRTKAEFKARCLLSIGNLLVLMLYIGISGNLSVLAATACMLPAIALVSLYRLIIVKQLLK